MTEAASEPLDATGSGAAARGLDRALARNREFAAGRGHEGIGIAPALGVVVIGCLDPRVDPAHLLGLDLGDALVLRNGGGRVTREVIDDLALISALGERTLAAGPPLEVAVLHHTDCASRLLADDEFRSGYARRIEADAATLVERAVIDPARTVAQDVELLRASRALSPRLSFSGHVYDVATGLVTTVVAPVRRAAVSGGAT
jgi:carbonic anhydrase